MNTVAGIGEDTNLEGFALAGVKVTIAQTDSEISDAWRNLDTTVAMVILSARAAHVLADELGRHPDRLTVVMP